MTLTGKREVVRYAAADTQTHKHKSLLDLKLSAAPRKNTSLKFVWERSLLRLYILLLWDVQQPQSLDQGNMSADLESGNLLNISSDFKTWGTQGFPPFTKLKKERSPAFWKMPGGGWLLQVEVMKQREEPIRERVYTEVHDPGKVSPRLQSKQQMHGFQIIY